MIFSIFSSKSFPLSCLVSLRQAFHYFPLINGCLCVSSFTVLALGHSLLIVVYPSAGNWSVDWIFCMSYLKRCSIIIKQNHSAIETIPNPKDLCAIHRILIPGLSKLNMTPGRNQCLRGNRQPQ